MAKTIKPVVLLTFILVLSIPVRSFSESAIPIYVNGQEMKLHTAPVMEEGRMMVPMRAYDFQNGYAIVKKNEDESVYVDIQGNEILKR